MTLGRIEVDRRFRYWPPDTPDKVRAHEAVRHLLHATALALDELLPDGDERDRAVDALELTGYHSHAAIARPPAEVEM